MAASLSRTLALGPTKNPKFRVFNSTPNPDFSPNLNLSNPPKNPLIQTIRITAKTAVLTAALLAGNLAIPAKYRAEELYPATSQPEVADKESSPLTHFLENNPSAVDALKSLLFKNLEAGNDTEAMKILRRLVESQPSELQWKFLMARLLSEMGEPNEARSVFEEILSVNPLSFEALFENALLMDRSGEGPAVLARLEEALQVASSEKEARDVKLIMAQIMYLQKNIDGALENYEQLAKEDPKDYRPYFCKGVIYSLLDKNKEAREEFAKYHELAPKKFEVEGFLQTPLSRIKLFGSDSDN
ncbi:protein SLOW GREEN 1, chloroplastic [Amborella trichopoda]|uniref:Uncharacterized protein n=1 Tax=Amborella trichopoda TaxID=13333 RepID=W1PP40_AMBTC|nr:protein SLOW GREEN 1, chloroplastic [Amborella trichopoda]ERN09574.1 hypothetical protein AMTR_s00029p00161320 [Amborella trichopoda]|eukprot:XP_006847993.1 protein SLOW GREEN 1, chloroplastic [Amborella trichopoda]